MQTYDNATKVVHDQTKQLMSLAAGISNIGQTPVGDVIAMEKFPKCATCDEEDAAILALLERMADQKQAFWSKTGIPPEKWPGPTLLLALPSIETRVPRVWSVAMDGERFAHTEILEDPGVWLEGSPNDVFALLYGFHPVVSEGLKAGLGVSDQQFREALVKMKVLRPVERLNLMTMPLQDAIDLAVFLASVQIEMDRFLPGTPVCGHPIDVMVLRMVPTPEILTYPGKSLHHPLSRGTLHP